MSPIQKPLRTPFCWERTGQSCNVSRSRNATSQEPALQSPEVFPTQSSLDKFQALANTFSEILGPSSGIDSEDVNVNELVRAMQSYTSEEKEWQRYALTDQSRGYAKNLVDEGNGKCNILVVVWNPGHGSPIHDHANAHCVMKILKGELEETLYEMPDTSTPQNGMTSPGTRSPPKAIKVTIYQENEATYISDKIGLHKITNPSPTEMAVSLHLYTPPHAASFGFNLFDAETGKKTHVDHAKFFSSRGVQM